MTNLSPLLRLSCLAVLISAPVVTSFQVMPPRGSAFLLKQQQQQQQQRSQQQQQQQPASTATRRCSSSSLNSIPNAFDTLTSGLASICRLPFGVTVDSSVSNGSSATSTSTATTSTTSTSTSTSTTTDILTLYDVENDPNCRLVRERLTELDLNYRVVPAAPNSKVFNDPSYKYSLPRGTTLPTLSVGNNNDKMLSGAQEITHFLDDTYGSGSKADDEFDESDKDFQQKTLDFVFRIGNHAASLLRIGRGRMVSPAASTTDNMEPLIMLYSYEGNQFCRLVREVMTELDLVYEIKSAGKNSPRRKELAKLTGGSTACPYLIDPNTSESMPESAAMIQYLYQTYAKYTPPNEVLQFASDKIIVPFLKPIFSFLTKLQAGGTKDENISTYNAAIEKAKTEITSEITPPPTTKGEPVVVLYTYALSPFCWEAKALLDRLNIAYTEISLGQEWVPGLIDPNGGSEKRAALLEMTGQSSLPHIFVNGQTIGGGLFDGLVPALNDGRFWKLLKQKPPAVAAEAAEAPKSKVQSTEDDMIMIGAFE